MKNLNYYLYLNACLQLTYNEICILIFFILAKLEEFYHPNHNIMIKLQNGVKKIFC